MKVCLAFAAVAASVALVGSSASAYTNNGDGTGFVGKGEVQTLLGFNNKQMQDTYQDVTFKYVATTEVTFECEWWTGPDHNRKYHKESVSDTTDVNAVVAKESRNNSKGKDGDFTGWYVTLPQGSSEPVEVTDALCGGAGKSIIPGSVEVGEASGGLFAVFDGVDFLLQLDAPAEEVVQ